VIEYAELRILLTPSLQGGGQWDIQILESPLTLYKNKKATVVPVFTKDRLRRLRRSDGWPDAAEMETIGQQVWQSIMPPTIDEVFAACLQFCSALNKRMRLRLVFQGQESHVATGAGIALAELPVEALFKDVYHFVATDLKTPVSRSLREDPDRDPLSIRYPLRMLVVVSTPDDMPSADAQAEAAAIRQALSSLTGPRGLIDVEICDPPTRSELTRRLQRSCQILHFVGHGGFDLLGDDPSPQPYLCFSRPSEANPGRMVSDNVSARDLAVLLRNTDVRLAVFTACQSAAPAPDPGVVGTDPYPGGAFEGVAQRLLSDISEVSATVAMQFDIESEAAVIFTRTFYENLLNPDNRLDEVVTLARRALATHQDFGVGHRAWVTPTVYWRCREGKVFNIDSVLASNVPDHIRDADRELLTKIATYRRVLDDIAREPLELREMLEPKRREWQGMIQEFQRARAELLGDSIRLYGGSVRAGQNIDCRLSLRVLLPPGGQGGQGVINQVKITVAFDSTKMSFVQGLAGTDAAGGPPFTNPVAPGQLQVMILEPSGGNSWSPREYDIGLLRFHLNAGLRPEILDLQLQDLEIRRDGQRVASFRSLDAVVFVEEDV